MKNLVFMLIVFCPVLALGAVNIEFGWDANTEADLAGYRLYQSESSGEYVKGNFIAEIPAPTISYVLEDIAEGTHCWVLTAYDVSGNESGWSNEVTLTVDLTAPAPPQGFWGLIQKLISWLLGGFNVKLC